MSCPNDPREMAGGTPPIPQPIEKLGTTPEAVKNPSWFRRVFRGEPGARHPNLFLKKLARAFDVSHSGFYGLSHEIGYALDTTFQEMYEDPRVSEELKYVGASTPPNYPEIETRKQGVAEYVRRWLSGDPSLAQIAPQFTGIWNRWMQSDDLVGTKRIHRDALKQARVEIDVYQGLTPREQTGLHIVRPRSLG